MPSDQALIRSTACAIVDQLNSGEVTPLDLLDALENRIAEIDGKTNALPILVDRARAQAKALMQKPAGERGLLAGLPLPIKDLTNVAGVRTTQGSPIYKDTIPAHSDIVVELLESNGGVVYAKSNTPEFGAGAPYLQRSLRRDAQPVGHLALRFRLLRRRGGRARDRDGVACPRHRMGGSLRNPASFCGVVGLRPSIGRVPHSPAFKIDRNLTVHGPMARNVEDIALLLDAMSGEHPADPLSLPRLPTSFLSAARSGKRPRRVAYSPDLGITPVDPEVAAITRKAASRFAEAGVIVEEAHPDLREAHECFHVLRAFDFAITKAALLRSKREYLKPEVIWNIEEGLKLPSKRSNAPKRSASRWRRERLSFQELRFVADAGHNCRAVPDREPLCRRMRRQKIRQLRRMARHRLRHYTRLLSGAVVTVRIYRIGAAGRTANGRGTAWRGAIARGCKGIGRYPGRARHTPIEPKAAPQ